MRISWFCGSSQKFCPQNLGAWCPLARHKRAIQELQENHIFHQFTKVFSLKHFPLYSMLLETQIVKFSRTLIIGASAVSPTLAENRLHLYKFMFVWYVHIHLCQMQLFPHRMLVAQETRLAGQKG